MTAVQGFQKRDYQLESDAAILAGVSRGVRRGLIVLPTGLGKTVVLTGVPHVLEIQEPDVTLIIAHREELIEQTVRKVLAWDPNAWVEVEKAERRASAMANVVVGSVATLQGKRLEDFLGRFARRIKLLIVDEAHHATAPSYRKLIEKVVEERDDSLVLGFTATPNRSDNAGLSSVFDEILYHRNIKWAIENGYLVNVACYRVFTDTDLSSVHVRAGDFAQNELAEAVNTDPRNTKIVSAYLDTTPDKKAIVFCVDVAHARELAATFNRAGVPAEWASGETPKTERAAIIERFRTGETKVLCNCALWVEGFDEPSVEVVIPAAPTKSGLRYTQMAGRGLRPLDEVAHHLGPETTADDRLRLIGGSSKPECIILDVVDQAKRHTLMTFPTLWGLPPKLNPQGKRITEVEQAYDELVERDPKAAHNVESFDQIKVAVERVDLFSVPEIDESVKELADLTWMLVRGERDENGEMQNFVYRLRLPKRTIAKDRNGNEVFQFDRRYKEASDQIRRGNRLQKGDSLRDMTLAAMNVDPKAITEIEETLEIRQDVLGHAEVALLGNIKEAEVPTSWERELGTADDLAQAFKRAEQWLTNNRATVRNALAQAAGWRAKPPTDGQMNIMRRMGVPEHMIPRTSGEASLLITRLIDRKKAGSAA